MPKTSPQFKIVPLEPVEVVPSPEKKSKSLSRWAAFGLGFLAILLVGGGVGTWWLSTQNFKAPDPTNADRKMAPRFTPVPAATHDDLAGFTFEYPEDVILNTHAEDKENYAHVELTHKDHLGKIVVWVKDLPLTAKKAVIKDVSEWVTSDPILISGNAVDTTLGEKAAKKILLKGPPEKEVTGVVFDEALWIVEGELVDKAYWSETYKMVADSFVFKPIPGEKTAGDDLSISEQAVDEEEVVE